MSEKSVMLSRDAILTCNDIVIKPVETPEWGGMVYVKSLTGAERDRLEASMISDKSKGDIKLDNFRAKLCSLTICDAAGVRLFKADDCLELGKKNAAALDRIFTIAQQLSGIGKADVEELTAEIVADPLSVSPSV